VETGPSSGTAQSNGNPQTTSSSGVSWKSTLLGAAVSAVVVVIGGGAAYVNDWLTFHRPSSQAERVPPTTAPAARPKPTVVTIDKPSSGGQEPWCTRVEGTATLLEGKALVLAVHPDQDPRTYFEAAIDWDEDHWSGIVRLDDEDNQDAVGHNYTVMAVVMDKTVVDYLKLTNKPGETWWSTPFEEGLPPTADPNPRQISLKRSNEPADC
jgi:hypothetical protein